MRRKICLKCTVWKHQSRFQHNRVASPIPWLPSWFRGPCAHCWKELRMQEQELVRCYRVIVLWSTHTLVWMYFRSRYEKKNFLWISSHSGRTIFYPTMRVVNQDSKRFPWSESSGFAVREAAHGCAPRKLWVQALCPPLYLSLLGALPCRVPVGTAALYPRRSPEVLLRLQVSFHCLLCPYQYACKDPGALMAYWRKSMEQMPMHSDAAKMPYRNSTYPERPQLLSFS